MNRITYEEYLDQLNSLLFDKGYPIVDDNLSDEVEACKKAWFQGLTPTNMVTVIRSIRQYRLIKEKK